MEFSQQEGKKGTPRKLEFSEKKQASHKKDAKKTPKKDNYMVEDAS